MSMKYGLLGEKLGHSYSKPIHEALGRYAYELHPLPREELAGLLTRRDFLGLNVTIPYKKDVIPYCDELGEEVVRCGSANTLVMQNGKLIAHNTDIFGFMYQMRHLGVEAKGKKAAVLGSGGASCGAVAALEMMGAGEILVISRKGPVDYEALYRDHSDVEILVNATPVGMYPRNLETPVDLDKLPHLQAVLDMIYNPAVTRLMMDAQARGIPCESGLRMLVAQAMKAAEFFLNEKIPDEKIEEIYGKVRSEMLNVVLVGMPGCGKTTLGILLAKKLGHRFTDADLEVEKAVGMPVPEFINTRGIEAFRLEESRVLARLGQGSAQVIATGGGAVTRPENFDPLRQNGVILHVERPRSMLATEGRPLSKNQAALAEMEKVRMPLYRNWADAAIENLDLNKALCAAEEAFYETAGH